MATSTNVVRLDFGDGKSRKLKCRHKHMREAVRASGKSVTELVNDPFGGYCYLIQALLQPGSAEPVTLDKASDLIDLFVDTGNDMNTLTKALIAALSGYLNIELTKTVEEEEEGSDAPNAATPVAPGPSAD
jgi:hypothetical protein